MHHFSMASISGRRTYKAPLSRISRTAALIRTALLSVTVAIVLFGVLTLQMALGNDPAIGAGRNGSPANAPAAPRPASTASTALPSIPSPAPQVSIPTPTPVQTSVS